MTFFTKIYIPIINKDIKRLLKLLLGLKTAKIRGNIPKVCLMFK
jgi:hypothetical protein